ncbi:methylated-DNA-[protein]-cysteine S-methyltransferase [Desulfonauticus submarinus]|uniref:Methylated-DNA--protein-cysteine methyltransferase n=1 Tax=Desulfonauticus submarinus TaxID=206665 RepID=A0A1H0BBD7_9BACT|nr:MGMT family protein [Desulfonauticus submarinus]SDN42947.1 methylated-DNA-[protein]-cysteine S-methyltransferase [Desulfonauticus submarinus]
MQTKIITEIFSNNLFSLEVSWQNNLIIQTKISLPQKEKILFYSSYSYLIKNNLQKYITQTPINWLDPPLAWHILSQFSQTVLKVLFKKVQFGQTVTYSKLALWINKPKAARAIGQVMARNPFPLIIPCHRVLGKNNLGGFSNGLKLKKILLQLENIKLCK